MLDIYMHLTGRKEVGGGGEGAREGEIGRERGGGRRGQKGEQGPKIIF